MIRRITILAENKNAPLPVGGFVRYYQDRQRQSIKAQEERERVNFCAADQRVPRVLSVDTDFTSGGILSGEERNARIRLIQYISGRIGQGRGSQSSILLTESSTLSGPSVIILGDHIARILTNSDTYTRTE